MNLLGLNCLKRYPFSWRAMMHVREMAFCLCKHTAEAGDNIGLIISFCLGWKHHQGWLVTP